MRTKLLLIGCLLFGSLVAQSPFDAFRYQGYLNQTKEALYQTDVNTVFTLYRGANKEELLYEEKHTLFVDALGYFAASIGEGTPTANSIFSSLSAVSFSANDFYYLHIQINGESLEYVRIMSVPFSMIAQKTMQKFSLNELTDVDTLGIKENDVLKWDGSKWKPSPDLFYDTIPYADTTLFAIRADTAKYADTAFVALQSKDAWLIHGNSNINPTVNHLGTNDAQPLHFITNGTRRMTILPNGNIGIGTQNPTTDLHMIGDNGILFEGTTGVGTIPVEGEGTRFMWYPAKAALRIGTIDPDRATFWNNTNIGEYSFAFGRNVRARAAYSYAFGELTDAAGQYSMAVGYQSSTAATAAYSFAAGFTSRAIGPYSVAMGRANSAIGEASSAFNYHTTARGNYSQSFGFYSEANGNNSTAIGFKAVANHDGSFVFSDRSSSSPTVSTAENQFLARVSGGVVFYTSGDLSTGVRLPAGSGSWSSLSDSTAKSNIFKVDDYDILNKIEKIKVYEWSYINEKGVKHIGPMAQSFYGTFGYGSDNKFISTVDIDGVNLSAIKALYDKSLRIENVIEDYHILLKKYNELSKEKEQLEKRLDLIEKKMTIHGKL
jgi:hypothetical protein